MCYKMQLKKIKTASIIDLYTVNNQTGFNCFKKNTISKFSLTYFQAVHINVSTEPCENNLTTEDLVI